MKAAIVLAAALLVGTGVPLSTALAQSAGDTNGVLVLKGGKTEGAATASPSRTRTAGVTVFRGRGSTKYTGQAPLETLSITEDPDRWMMAGGDAIWLIDREREKLLGCVMRGNFNVGGFKIVCRRRSMPK